jgi:hypothetical protein
MVPRAGFDGYEKSHPHWDSIPKASVHQREKQGIIFLNSIVMIASYYLCGE